MNGNYQIGDVVFGNWVIKEKIGEGSFGKVFGIERNDFGHTYKAALKVITVPQNEAELQMALDEGMDEEDLTQHFYSAVEEIVQEFYLMSKVKGSSHVVGYEDHTVIPHTQGIGWDILIRMERLTPLLTWAFEHPMSRRDIIRLGIHMCSALELCQKHQILHRDIKPENIFVSDSGDYKLGDFGVARTMEKTMSGMSKKGTYNYMAPEVYKGEEYGFRADMYSVGIVLYRLLNHNRIPFLPPAPERVTMRDRENALNCRIKGEELPFPCYAQDALGQIVCKAAAPVPGDRYESPAQMRKVLEDMLLQEKDDTPVYPDAKDQKKRQEGSVTLNNRNHASVTPDMSATPVMGVNVDKGDKDDQEDIDRTVSAWDSPKNTSHNSPQNHSKTNSVHQERKMDVPVSGPTEEADWEDVTEKTTSAFATPKKKNVDPASSKTSTRKAEDPKPVSEAKQKKKPGIIVFLLAAVVVVSIVMGIAYVVTSKQEANDLNLEMQWNDIAQPVWEKVYDGLVLGSGSQLNYIINSFEDINQALTKAGFSGLAMNDPYVSEKVNSSYDEYDIRITMEENYENSEWFRQITVAKESVFFKTEGVSSYYDAQTQGIADRVLPDALIIGKTTPMELGITEEMIQWVYKDDMEYRIVKGDIWTVNASIYSFLNPEELYVSIKNTQKETTEKVDIHFRKLEQGWILTDYDITFFVGQPGGSGEIGMHGEDLMDTIWDRIHKDLTANSGSVLDFTTTSMSEIEMRFNAAGFSEDYYEEESKIGVYHMNSNISFYMTEGQREGVMTRRITINPNSGYRLQDVQSVTYYEDADLRKVDAVLPMDLRVGATTLEDLGITEKWVQETTEFSTSMWDAYVYVTEYDGGHQVEIYALGREEDHYMDLIFCEASQGYVLVEMTVEFPVE